MNEKMELLAEMEWLEGYVETHGELVEHILDLDEKNDKIVDRILNMYRDMRKDIEELNKRVEKLETH